MHNVVTLVLAWNGRAYLHDCLNALTHQTYQGRHAILVVDNASTDDSRDLIQRDFPNIALHTNQRNLGFAGGNNAGLELLLAGRAPAPIDFIPDTIILLNQDTRVEPDWLHNLIDALDRHPNAGIVGCKIYFPDGQTLQHTGGQIIAPLATGTHRGTGEPDTGQYDREEPVEYVTGASMAIRRTLLANIGLLDEGFTPAYYEDSDYCYRARAAGFDVLYTPNARLRHDENTSLHAQSPAHQRAYHRNRIRFILKHNPLDTLAHTFALAEREAIHRWSLTDSLARKHAYIDALIDLPHILAQRSDTAHATIPDIIATLRQLHQTTVEEERTRRAESGYSAPAHPNTTEEPTMTNTEPMLLAETPETPVDVAAIMRQVRLQINARQGRSTERELLQALEHLNRDWDKIYEPLNVSPSRYALARIWDALRARLHSEVRSYLDPMIYRQTELNAQLVRALNNLFQRSQLHASTSELEALRDELIQLREHIRQLEERTTAQP